LELLPTIGSSGEVISNPREIEACLADFPVPYERVDADYHRQVPKAMCRHVCYQQSWMIGGSAVEFGMVLLLDLSIPITRRFQKRRSVGIDRHHG
jgi:hypothetical protein